MAFTQTPKGHRKGKKSYHQIGLMHAQFGGTAEEFLTLAAGHDFDVVELAAWQLDLGLCKDDAGAMMYANALVACAKHHGLEVAVLATHTYGQVLGDEVSAKTIQFLPKESETVQAYVAWRDAGNNPPTSDPFYVPPDVAKLARTDSLHLMCNAVRLAHHLGKAQDRSVPVSTFVGSPAGRWHHWFEFPPLPSSIGGKAIPNVHDCSRKLLVERHGPVLELCKQLNVKHGLECHPSEFGIGDPYSAEDYLRVMDQAGFSDVAGFNFDESHPTWQGVDPVAFVRQFGERIWSKHVKGVSRKERSPAGILGGHRPMNDPLAGWAFVTARCDRDACPHEEIIDALNTAGWDGALIIEHEDRVWDPKEGAAQALANIRAIDKAPSIRRHDEAFAQA